MPARTPSISTHLAHLPRMSINAHYLFWNARGRPLVGIDKVWFGLLDNVEARRAELLSAALTIWRWGRQNAADLEPGRPLGSFEQWSQWCRDPLVALGCRDAVERIDQIKSDDPHRRQIVEIFQTSYARHRDKPIKANALSEPVRLLLDPQGRGRQHIAARLMELTGTRAGGFVLTRQKPAGKWGAATYSLVRTSKA
jgi:hypothetical protein